MSNIRTAILGASGYTGGELIRLLLNHPSVEICHVTAAKHAGKKLVEVFPHLRNLINLDLEKLNPANIADNADIVFASLPHGASAEVVADLYEKGLKIVDLGADFRISEENYNKWYSKHPCPAFIENAVYGISELYKDEIAKSHLVANPGCYPTSAILPLAPLLKKGVIREDSIIIDSKSGASGAGRTPSLDLHFCEVNEGLKAYKVGAHRHSPEIEQHLSSYCKNKTEVTFTPHLLPISRGVLSTIYVNTYGGYSTSDLIEILKQFYHNSYFIRIHDEGYFPSISSIKGSNYCDIGVASNPDKKTAIIVSVIDNLVKGAAGQAIQNMNIMMGLPENTGLKLNPIFP